MGGAIHAAHTLVTRAYVRDLIRRDKTQTEEAAFEAMKARLRAAFAVPRSEYEEASADDIRSLDRVHLKLSLRDAGFGVGRKAGTRRNSKAISRASNTASGFEDKSQQISLS